MFSKILGKKNKTEQVLSSMDTYSKQKRYEALVQAYHKDLYRYGYWLTSDGQVAEDLVQETFLRAWRSLDSLKEEKAAKSWLITILRRENARRFERKQFDLVDIEDQEIADHHSSTNEQNIEDKWLRKRIGELEPEYKEPLIMQIIGGYSGEEIAKELGLNKNTVMTRLFRARNMLKDALDSTKKKARVI